MAEIPITFAAPMIRAILGGQKTQTRRTLSRAWAVNGSSWRGRGSDEVWGGFRFDEAESAGDSLRVPWCHPSDEPTPTDECAIYRLRPRVSVGDRMWVRETWKTHSSFAATSARRLPEQPVFYAADQRYSPSGVPWRSPLHMPRWASRITIEITDVRVQRLQEISEEDAVAEGIDPDDVWKIVGVTGPANGGPTQAFATIWDRIHSPGAWDANPWVVAQTFSVVRR